MDIYTQIKTKTWHQNVLLVTLNDRKERFRSKLLVFHCEKLQDFEQEN